MALIKVKCLECNEDKSETFRPRSLEINEDIVMAIIDNDIFLKEKCLVSEDVIKIGINYFTDFKKNKLKPHSL